MSQWWITLNWRMNQSHDETAGRSIMHSKLGAKVSWKRVEWNKKGKSSRLPISFPKHLQKEAFPFKLADLTLKEAVDTWESPLGCLCLDLAVISGFPVTSLLTSKQQLQDSEILYSLTKHVLPSSCQKQYCRNGSAIHFWKHYIVTYRWFSKRLQKSLFCDIVCSFSV